MFNNLIGSKTANRSNLFFAQLHNFAISTCLIVYQSRKFSAEGFLLTLIKSILTGKASFNQMASRLGGFEPLKMSKQAFWKRVNDKAIAFLLEALASSLKQKYLTGSKKLSPLAPLYSRVLVEDSVIHRLHHSNADHTPGHGNGKSKTSVLKVDVTIDLLTGSCFQSALHGGTEQDKEIGKNLVDLVKKRDLVMRDMGYFIIKEFALIEQKKAFWLSRVPANVIITIESGVKIEKVLAAFKGGVLESTVHVGKKEKHPARLIAVRATEEVTRKNLKEAQKRTDGQKRVLTKEQRERCHWHLIVTNIPKTDLKASQLGELYRCRWNIEILFRAWKQGMNLEAALNRRSSARHHQALVLAAMIYKALTIVVVNLLKLNLPRGERISIEKVFDFMSEHLMGLSDLKVWSDFETDRRHVRMDPHKGRRSLATTWMQLIS